MTNTLPQPPSFLLTPKQRQLKDLITNPLPLCVGSIQSRASLRFPALASESVGTVQTPARTSPDTLLGDCVAAQVQVPPRCKSINLTRSTTDVFLVVFSWWVIAASFSIYQPIYPGSLRGLN